MKELEKCAEILVECGYAISTRISDGIVYIIAKSKFGDAEWNCKPFTDTLEGRRQADAAEDWLWFNENILYSKSFHAIDEPINAETTHHQWRLDRIKWAINEIIKNEHDKR